MKKWLSGLRWLTAAATVLLTLLLCWQCIDLYMTGNSPDNLDANGVHITPVFSADQVSARLTALQPALGGYALLVLLALTAHALAEPEKPRLTIPAENRLRLMKARTADLPEAARAEERLRFRVRMAAGAAAAVCVLSCLPYMLNRANFTSWELEGVMGQMLLHVGPWVLMAFGALSAAAVICERSILRELDALKAAPKAAPAPAAAEKRSLTPAVRLMLLGAALLFIVLGVMNGGLYDVLVKAINICTECIGLG